MIAKYHSHLVTDLKLQRLITSGVSRWVKNLMFRHCTQVGSEKVIPRWEQDYQLQSIGKLGLFYEYLEMGETLHTLEPWDAAVY